MSDLPPDIAEDEAPQPAAPMRDRDLLGRRSKSPLRDRLDELFTTIAKGFEDQSRRSDQIEDFWDCYNCEANGNRYYNGTADIYVPIIHDAVEAIVTRWLNQMFPQSGQFVDVVGAPNKDELIALTDHYIRVKKFKTQTAAPLIRNGIIEGQVNLYMDWAETDRVLVSRETHGPIDPVTMTEMPGPEIVDIKEEEIREGLPVFEVLHDSDVLVWPQTADSVEEALACGGGVAIVRRWTKAQIDRLAKSGTIRPDEAKVLKTEMGRVATLKDVEKHLLEHVYVKKGGKEVVVWEVWHMLPLDEKGKFSEDGAPRLCRLFFGPSRAQLGCKRNPFWNDRCPLLSAPLRKMSGVFKGPSLIQYVDSLQYEANDAVNEGADAATLSAAPIVRRDPEKSNGPLVYNVGAVWEAPKDAIELLTFPDMTPRALTRVEMAKQAIFQALSVNPSMLPQQTGRKPGAKLNQAEVAMEQSVDLLQTAVATSILDEAIFTPAVAWTIDLDYQFRDRDLLVRMYGEDGREAAMQEVAPLQNRSGFFFTWRGAEQARQNAMMMQQGTAFLNIMRTIAPQLLAEGKAIRIAPVIEAQSRNIFGPVLGARTIVDIAAESTIGTETEVEMMLDGFETFPHPLDNDQQKIMAFRQAMQMVGDPHGTIRARLAAQLRQMQMKAMAQGAAQMQRQIGGGPQPGGGGQPQPGAAPAGPRLIKGPPGTIAQDQMPRAGAAVPPRRA